ncbi:MAG: hypothetical protein ACI9LE_001293 [Paraglaciecola sp.]|jgi:hypothetical protein
MNIEPINRRYLDTLRGASILRVMLAHLGLSRFFIPYSQYISILLPVFFFVSGAVSFNSVLNSKNKPYYFVNRYIALITLFLVFLFPFLLLLILNEHTLTGYGVFKWPLDWPSRGSYPIDMRQLWFINALILMFFISYPIFKLSRESLKPLVIVFFVSLIYIPLAEQQNLINSWIR